MSDEDPITQFFPGEEDVDLYAVLLLKPEAKIEEIKKSYRKLALVYHPDKHATASEADKATASTKFQQIGFTYAVLSDENRRSKYDKTGRTDEGLGIEAGEEGGWEAYFEDLFDRVTKGKLDEMKKEYQGSSEELDDLKAAYEETGGSIGDIMMHIPHSTIVDEPRFIKSLSDLIANGELAKLAKWESSVKDEKARLVRKKQGDKEAKEAEELAKELGVWDEFYGNGKPGSRKGKGKKGQSGDDDEEDHSALQALILKKKQNMDGFFDSLAAKYAGADSSKGKKTDKGKKKRGMETEDVAEESPRKKSRRNVEEPPEIDDAEFEKLQAKLFGDKAKASSATTPPSSRGKKAGRSRRAK
ncbi:hypothetical protein SERLADRAFT_454153 [Serpula lacrymans var. lacrymans S7.9]|uniref:J domain-containing protein n=1 Tax=Serpula lacrymans var. lacrymans (strain S7.9) TaxID=578457 RepID=F8PDY2_SERL9|nr:uncharacterized protein SERLADRAFT_454153 [Serpula lacrymans var. lacrymans S7.9]EGO18579.1 hypothetical protein SERLADRAFT_454153 [Serpula lacrymans var. lacrymans S7.9]